MHYRLIGVGNDFKFELKGTATMTVGRAVSNECPVVDPTISRKHAELRLTANGIDVTDAGSSNGTFINGVRIDRAVVAPGAEVTFGKVVFRVERVEAPRPVTPVAPKAATPPKPAAATIVRQIPKAGEQGDLSGDSGSLNKQLAGQADPAEKDRRKLAILLEVWPKRATLSKSASLA